MVLGPQQEGFEVETQRNVKGKKNVPYPQHHNYWGTLDVHTVIMLEFVKFSFAKTRSKFGRVGHTYLLNDEFQKKIFHRVNH